MLTIYSILKVIVIFLEIINSLKSALAKHKYQFLWENRQLFVSLKIPLIQHHTIWITRGKDLPQKKPTFGTPRCCLYTSVYTLLPHGYGWHISYTEENTQSTKCTTSISSYCQTITVMRVYQKRRKFISCHKILCSRYNFQIYQLLKSISHFLGVWPSIDFSLQFLHKVSMLNVDFFHLVEHGGNIFHGTHWWLSQIGDLVLDFSLQL